uniref:Uncharacterized protein n=2 Tax=Rhinopithecus TaxID=542827 RepID=A0A2K6MR89_RHIBE
MYHFSVGKKNLDLYVVTHFRCKDNISFYFCTIICMNSVTRGLYCDIINLYCYLKMIVCRTEDFH